MANIHQRHYLVFFSAIAAMSNDTLIPKSYRLPNLHALCPYQASINPHYEKVAKASAQWVLSFNVINGKKLEFFREKNSQLLCAWTYPCAEPEKLRICCDFTNLLFAVDSISDDQNTEDAYHTGRIIVNTVKDDKFDDGSVLCKMTKEYVSPPAMIVRHRSGLISPFSFKKRFLPHVDPLSIRRFLKHNEDYVDAFSLEAELREKDVVLNRITYDSLRRENSAVRTCFGLISYVLGQELPDDVYEHPVFVDMHLAAVDMVSWSNVSVSHQQYSFSILTPWQDLYSYNMEQAMPGHANSNILTVLQKEKGIDLQAAADYVGVHFKELVNKFEANKQRLPSFGEELDVVIK